MSVNFNNPFDPFYDQFSIHEADFSMPSYFSSYVPDNQTDYQCVNVISPAPEKGAVAWTINGSNQINSNVGNDERWITLGIYRDEGRAAAQRPSTSGLSWTRSGYIVTILDPSHKLHAGDIINVWNINIPIMENVEIISVVTGISFAFNGLISGGSSGSGAMYQENFATNFYENYRVFRLLPSFKLLPYADVLDIFTNTAPIPAKPQKTLYSITTNTNVNLPIGSNDSSNYQLPTIVLPTSSKSSLPRRFGQVYDAGGQPLTITYLQNGYPSYVNNVDSPNKNPQIFNNTTVNAPSADPYIYVYDYYGLQINDASRAPTYSTGNIIRNFSISGNVNNFTISPAIDYISTLNDLFGNLSIGVQQDNALVIRKQILPLELNAFNKPIKSPIM